MAGTPSTETYNAAGSTDYERKVDTLLGTHETPNGRKAHWPTTTTTDAKSSGALGYNGQQFMTLTDAAKQASWRTPDHNQRGGDYMDPEKVVERIARGHQVNLNGQAVLASPWVSPQAADANGSGINQHTRSLCQQTRTSGPTPSGSPAATASVGQLNPAHSRWLMGYPPVWDACAVTAMPSSRRLRPRSSGPTSTSAPTEKTA